MRDLRDWLSQVERIGELHKVNGASLDLEIGAITAENSKNYGPALLFDNIPGYPVGYRILTNCILSRKRLSLTFNLQECQSDEQLITILEDLPEQWEAKASHFPSVEVSWAPVKENIIIGEKVNISSFPAPRWHEKDGGKYIGTGCIVIMRDPDTGQINIGTYRMMVIDDKSCTIYISTGKHGQIIMSKYHERGLSCPVAVSFGHDPLLLTVAGLEIDLDVGEYNYAGAMLGQSIKVIPGELTGLPVPASSELVFEGECLPNEKSLEGPFGEWTGHYAGGKALAPVFRVNGIMHRNEPIILGCSPAGRADEYDIMYSRAFIRSAMIKKVLKEAGIKGIRGVWLPELGGTRLIIVVSLKQEYAGHAAQAAYVASQCRDGAYMGRYIIIVDDDIDPTNIKEVLWAMCTRVDPERDIEIIRHTWSSRLDPCLSIHSDPANNTFYNSRAVIYACKPFEKIKSFPERITYNPELLLAVRKKFKNLFSPGE